MQLLFLFLLFVGPYLLLALAGQSITSLRIAPVIRAKAGLSLFFLFTSLGTFYQNRRDVGHGAARNPLPRGTNLHYRSARVARSHRRLDSASDEIDWSLPYLDADRPVTCEHLLGLSPG